MANRRPVDLLRWVSRWLGALSRVNGVYQEVTLENVSAEVKRATTTPPDPEAGPGQKGTEASRN